MIKKKVIGLSILLLVLLLGLSTTTYASGYVITNDDIDLIVNYYESSNTYKDQIKSNLHNKLRNVYNNFDTAIVVVDYSVQNGSMNSYTIVGFDSSHVVSISNSKNINYMSLVLTSNTRVMKTGCYIDYQGYHNNYSDNNVSGVTFGTGSQLRTRYLLIPTDLNGKFTDAPWQSTDILTFDYFEFIVNTDVMSGTAKIYGDTSMTDYYLVPYNAYSVRLGSLYESKNLDNIVKRKYRYSQANRDFELIKEYVSNVNDSNFYLSGDGYLHVYEYYQPDTTEFIIFTAKDSVFDQIVVPIYYTTRNTNIVNGYINLDNTFSGDYYNNYNNDQNTQAIINNTNNDSEVDTTLNEFISGDYQDVANKFGFKLFTQEYYDFIYYTVTEIVDVLTESGDVYFDYSMHGETPTRIYASSFTTPNGTLKTFLQMFLISCTVYAFYKYIADLLELISTGNILEALDEFKVDRNIFKM